MIRNSPIVWLPTLRSVNTTRIFIIVIFGCFYLVGQVFAQSGSLVLTSAAGSPGGQVSLALSLNASGGSQPAAIQWQLSHHSSDVAGITATIGPAATAGGKSLSCSGSAGSYTCLLSGLNSNAIGNGVIATIAVTLSTTITTSTSISVINTIGASPSGSVVPLTATGGTITVGSGPPLGLQSLSCNPTSMVTPATATCTVSLNRKVLSKIPITLQDNSRHLALPAAILISSGSSSTNFTVGAGAVTATEVVVVAATLGSSSKTVHLVLRPSQTVSSQTTVNANNSSVVQPTSGAGVKLDTLSCLPKAVTAGDSITCQVHFGSMSDATILNVASNGDLQVPASVATRARQSTLHFQGYSSPSAQQQSVVLQVASGDSMVQDTVTIVPSASPVLTVPGKQLVKKTTALTFTVSAANPGGGAVALSALNLPLGASFDPRNGQLNWTPSERQSGSYDVGFTAENTSHLSATAHVLIEVGSGKPVVTTLVNGASRSPTRLAVPVRWPVS